jgi:hypothetical protein
MPTYAPAVPPLTAAKFYTSMNAIMAQFSETISSKFGQSINDNREAMRESTTLICKEIRTMLSNLSADTKQHRDELSKGLNSLGQFIAREVAAAIATTSEKANSLNKASLQTIIDLLQNCSNVHVGDHLTSPASFLQPSPNFGPSTSGAQPVQDEPKPRGIGSLPKNPSVSFVNHDDDKAKLEDLPPIIDLDMEGTEDHQRSEPVRGAACTYSARFASMASAPRQPRKGSAGYNWGPLSPNPRESSPTPVGTSASMAQPPETTSGFDW